MADNFQLLALLGTGTFGEAWVAKSRKHDEKCVVKVINILRLSERELDQALTEVSVLGRMHHVNIVRYLDAYVHNGALNIAMEYADGGDLHKKICDQKGVPFTREVIMDWFVQICMALQYVHKQNILHRDLKSQNIFLTSKSVIKVGDFGIARILKDSTDLAVTTIGTPFYLSPEICQKKPYNHKSDMWALGCVLYEMCCLKVPFDAESLQDLILRILHENYDAIPRSYGSTLSLLIKKLLDKNPESRPSADSVLSMAAVKQYSRRFEPKLQLKERRHSLPNIPAKSSTDEKEQKRSRVVSTDKENLDPKMAGKTYLVRNPKFKQLSRTPNVSVIVAKQRKERPSEDVIPRSKLFSGLQRKSSLKSDGDNKPTIQRKISVDNGSNDKESVQSKDEVMRQRQERRSSRDQQRRLTELSDKVSKPPSGRRSSLDSKPLQLRRESSISKGRLSIESVRNGELIRKPVRNGEYWVRRGVIKDGNSGPNSSDDLRSRSRPSTADQGTPGKRPAPIGSECLGELKNPPPRALPSQCGGEDLNQSDADNEVFLDQNISDENQSCKKSPPPKVPSSERIRRSSSYDRVFVSKQGAPNDRNIPRVMSAGSIGSTRLAKDGVTYKISSSLMPGDQFKDAVQEEMLVNMDSFNTIYNAMCQFVKDQGQGQKLLYVTMVKAIGQREADRYINKVTQGLQDCVLYQDVKQIVPENRHKLLPLVFCYILMTKFCK